MNGELAMYQERHNEKYLEKAALLRVLTTLHGATSMVNPDSERTKYYCQALFDVANLLGLPPTRIEWQELEEKLR